MQKQAQPNIVIALIGNKLDLSNLRQVSHDDGQKFSNENNLIFMEASAKDGTNVNETFQLIAERLPKTETNLATKARSFSGMTSRRIDIANENVSGHKTKGCC